ncbi:uncharacterized protein FFMR_08655 [Fusarium fujikuroi]|nr:uncharacterized protein FFMR_08655 [Fusarium fujikuroi]
MVNEYFLAPNKTTAPPPEGPIELGSILRNITEFDPLNRKAQKIPQEWLLPVDKKGSVEISLHDLHASNFSLKAKALGLFGLGTGASTERTKTSNNKISCECLETLAFNPTESYIKNSIEDANVNSFMRGSRFKLPVYMVTGLKVVRGAAAITSTSRRVTMEHDTSLLPSGAPAAVGVKAGHTSEITHGVKWDRSTDFILAFRVKKVWLGHRDGFKHQPHRKKAVMQDGSSSDSESDLPLQSDDTLTPEEVKEMLGEGGMAFGKDQEAS